MVRTVKNFRASPRFARAPDVTTIAAMYKDRARRARYA